MHQTVEGRGLASWGFFPPPGGQGYPPYGQQPYPPPPGAYPGWRLEPQGDALAKEGCGYTFDRNRFAEP
jgi:hypothetical protein